MKRLVVLICLTVVASSCSSEQENCMAESEKSDTSSYAPMNPNFDLDSSYLSLSIQLDSLKALFMLDTTNSYLKFEIEQMEYDLWVSGSILHDLGRRDSMIHEIIKAK